MVLNVADYRVIREGKRRHGEVKIQWMNHTGFVVRDMEKALVFYRDRRGYRLSQMVSGSINRTVSLA